MKGPTISIIIPTYNSFDTLSECLESIVLQTYPNLEVLLIDNLSTDRTLDIARAYATKYNYIKIISEKDHGIYDAMNKGIKLSKGEWLYFMGSDDSFVDSNILKELIPSLTSDIDLIYGNVIWGKTEKIYDGVFDLEKLIRYKNICQQAIFYNKSLFSKMGLFKNEFKYCADHYFNIQCFMSDIKIIYVDKIIAAYNDIGKSSMFNDEEFQKKRTLLIIERYENPIEVYEKFIKYNSQINFYKNSIDYKMGHFLLFPIRFAYRKIFKFLKR